LPKLGIQGHCPQVSTIIFHVVAHVLPHPGCEARHGTTCPYALQQTFAIGLRGISHDLSHPAGHHLTFVCSVDGIHGFPHIGPKLGGLVISHPRC
jgi:hypothetical protein